MFLLYKFHALNHLHVNAIGKHLHGSTVSKRNFFLHWINLMFNKIDEDRRKLFGADRTCAEWILRNGGIVKFVNMDHYLTNYNLLPPEGTPLKIKEVDASDSTISHYGFDHFNGCHYIDKIILHHCTYLEDDALGMLLPLNQSLNYLQVSNCGNISGTGLLKLKNLSNLKTLVVFNLENVKNFEEALNQLKSNLTHCDIKN